MKSFEQPSAIESYEDTVAESVCSLPVFQDHVLRMYQNLTQCPSGEAVSEEVLRATREVAHEAVRALIHAEGAAIDASDPNFRHLIVERADDALARFSDTPGGQEMKSRLRVAFIRSIGSENARGRAALIRHFELSFGLFLSVVFQASLYTMNRIDIRQMTPTEEEAAGLDRKLEEIFRSKGSEVLNMRGASTEEIVEEIVGDSKKN